MTRPGPGGEKTELWVKSKHTVSSENEHFEQGDAEEELGA